MAEAIFSIIDVCKENIISRGELEIMDVVMHDNFNIDKSDEKISKLFQNLDIHGDGKISKEHWVASWDSICTLLPDLAQISKDQFHKKVRSMFPVCEVTQAPLYATGGVSTFFSKPLYGTPGTRERADCVFFGCPFDSGSTYRSGCRFGPRKIREASQMLLTNCTSDYAPWMDKYFGKMRVYDAGDAQPTPFDLLLAVNQIYLYAKVLWNTSTRLIGLGGDHTLSWSLLAAARDLTNGPVAVIHLDAHLDTGDEYLGSKLSHGTSLGRAGASGCIDFSRLVGRE